MPAEYTYDPATDPLAIPRNATIVQHILNTTANETHQLDAICEARGWWRIDAGIRDVLDAFLTGTISLQDTAERLAAPIDESYTSADDGRMFWEMEMTARACRPQCTPDEALKFWGEPVAMCEPDPDPAAPYQTSTEGGLGRLWLSLNHASRKTDWRCDDDDDDGGQMLRLVQLVQTLKLRPNPPLPEGATPALRNNWVWASGKMWSDLTLLGASMRESWNDAPGGTMGFTELEVMAWERENAFVALLTATGTADFMNYGVWAMRDGLEGGIAEIRELRRTPEMRAKQLEVTLGVIVVWLMVAGKVIYQRCVDMAESVALVDSGVISAWRISTELSDARWRFWKKRLAKFVRDEKVNAMSRSHAVKAADQMVRLEEAHEEMR